MDNISAHMQELVNVILETRYTNLDLDYKCCQELLQESQRNGSAWGAAFACTYLGDYYIATNNTIQSGKHLIQAKKLCLHHSFQELYMQVCHFFGIYHSLLYDEQTALQYYLDGLKLSKIFNNSGLECLILNNIAHVFQCRDAYDEAKHYYFEALERLEKVDGPQYIRQRLLILYNLTDLFLFLKDLPMAKKYLQECEEVTSESENTKIYKELLLCANQCTLASLSKNRKEAVFFAEKLLVQHLKTFPDKHVISGVLYSVCKAMIDLEEREFSWKLLEEWSKVCTNNETFNIHRLMTLHIYYHDKFSSEEEQNQAYRKYFYALNQATAIESKVRADGMNAQIHLREIQQQQESILQENQILESIANSDGLTGIYNRRFINKMFSKIEHDSSAKRAGIIMLDVDYFKEYNDNYGHAKGDEVLISIAKSLSKFSSEGIWIGRYGGDEFICICLNWTDRKMERFICSVCTEIDSLSIAHEKSKCQTVVTLSIGYSSVAAAAGINTEKLLTAADQALYLSKYRGRNQWSKSEES